MDVTRKTTFKVHQFVDATGVEVADQKKATIMLAIGMRGHMKGLTMPISMKPVRQMKLKVGDIFTETRILSKKAKA
jgi:hypothetical protein